MPRTPRTKPVPLLAQTPWQRPAWGVPALVLLAMASYLPVMLWGGFVWDDRQFILDETALRDWAGLARIWFAPLELHETHYRPLTYFTFWLEYQLWGYDPRGYHVVNVLLHAANGVLLWRILARLAVPGAWLIAAVFAVHPLHVESVAWAIERKDVLSHLFYLGCLLAWLPFLEDSGSEGTWRRYGLVLALFVLGLLAKNMVVTLPAVLVVLHWWRRGSLGRRDALLIAPLFAITIAFIALDMWTVVQATPLNFGFSAVERTLMAALAVWLYVGQLVWPLDLPVIYPRWNVDAADATAWLALVAAVALVALLWLLRGRIGRGPLAGALVYAVMLSPTLGYVDHTYMLFSFVADRYQYLACVGVVGVLIGAAATLVARWPAQWRMAAHGMAAAMLLAFGVLTWQQSSIYSDQLTFFQHVTERNPEAAGAHLNLAQALIDEGRLEEAVQAGTIAVQQRPDSYDAHINLAIALGELERYDESERHLRRAVEIAPTESEPHANLAVLLSRRNELEEAEHHLRRAIELAPRDFGQFRNLAVLLALRGGIAPLQEALALYDQLLARGAEDFDLHRARGDILVRLGRHAEALTAWQQALDQNPARNAAFAVHVAMGRAEWAKSGDANATAPHYERALAIAPRHASTLGDLASLRIVQQRYEDAQAIFQQAIEQAPDQARFHAGLGYALYSLDQAKAAIASLERALELDPTLNEARSHLAMARQSQQASQQGTRNGRNGQNAQNG